MGVAAAVGVGITAVSSLVGGIEAKHNAAEKAAQDQQNSQYAQMQAAQALQVGAIQAGRIEQRASQIIGAQRAGFASSGIDENSGTAAQVQVGTRMQAALDALNAKNNASSEAWGHQINARNYQEQAGLDDEAGSQALAGSLLKSAGDIAGGPGKVAKTYNTFGGWF